MKIDDSALASYLVENLQPLTKANPNLLSKYVAALLKNTKPKKELETLCVDKLLDFLGNESQLFVRKLFCALEDGTILTYEEECQTTVADTTITVPASVGAKIAGKAMYNGDFTDSRNSSYPSYADTGMFCDSEEEGTDDEDDDRNHKHKRWPSTSRSSDRDVQDCSFNNVNKIAINGHSKYDTNHFMAENLKCLNVDYMNRDNGSKRLLGCDYAHGSPSNINQWDFSKESSFFRGDGRPKHQNNSSPEASGQGSGSLAERLGVREQRTALDGLDFNLPSVPLRPTFVPYSGRSSSSRENISQSQWVPFSGVRNGSLDQALTMAGVLQGTKRFSTSATLGPTGGRLKCLDFEERGYCLRGDLCPMEHGANRIVVEDVQSLSQFNLPLTIPSGRDMTLGFMSVSTPPLSPYSSNLSRATRDSNFPVLNVLNVPKVISTNNAFPEPDVYDPDQPFLNREQPATLVAGLKRHSSFMKYQENDEEEAAVWKRCRGASPNERKFERSSVNVTPQTLGQSVLDHISHIHLGESNAENSSGPTSSFLNHLTAQTREFVEGYEPQILAGMQKNYFTEKQERLAKSSGMTVGVSSVFQKEDRLHSTENSKYMSGCKWSTGLASERAQRTLYVSYIPSTNNRKDLLRAHFKKFGEVVDVRVPSQGDRAFIQFSRREDAEAALKSPEAVMGNRFIRLSWARRDSLPIVFADDDLVKPLGTGHNTSIGLRDLGLLTESSSIKTKQAFVVSAASEPVVLKTAGKPSTLSFPPASVTVLPKKQEELELMKEELRRKQDELAQKRDDFRRKLDRLSKQGSGATSRLLGDQVSNLMSDEAKTDNRGNQSSNQMLNLETLEAGLHNSQKEISDSAASFVKAFPSTDQSTSCLSSDLVQVFLGLTQASTGNSTPLSQRGSRGHSPGADSSSQGVPMRYKLDSCTTAFRVVPPFPEGLSDVTSLKDHFSMFEDLASVAVEDVDEKQQYFKVTFNTRSAAEEAFLQGRSYQGASLHLSWVPSSDELGSRDGNFPKN